MNDLFQTSAHYEPHITLHSFVVYKFFVSLPSFTNILIKNVLFTQNIQISSDLSDTAPKYILYHIYIIVICETGTFRSIQKYLKKVGNAQLYYMLFRRGVSYKPKMNIGYYNMNVTDECDKEQFCSVGKDELETLETISATA